MEHVIALDPGGRSGWSSARMSPDKFEYSGGGVLRQDLMSDWMAVRQGIIARYRPLPWGAGAPDFNVVVYESWFPRPQNGSMEWIQNDRLLPAQHIGQIRWIALTSGAKLVTQHPSDKPQALVTMPNRLHALNADSNEQHDVDARLHLWLYFWRNWFSGEVSPESTVVL